MSDRCDDVEKIRGRIRRKRAAYAARDPQGSYDLFLKSDAVCVYDLCPPPFYHGWDSVKRITEAFVDATEGELDIDSGVPEIMVSGDLACSWSIVRVRTVLKGGHAADITMRQTNIWRRVDGEWFIVHEHNSQPLDAEAMHRLLGFADDVLAAPPR